MPSDVPFFVSYILYNSKGSVVYKIDLKIDGENMSVVSHLAGTQQPYLFQVGLLIRRTADRHHQHHGQHKRNIQQQKKPFHGNPALFSFHKPHCVHRPFLVIPVSGSSVCPVLPF